MIQDLETTQDYDRLVQSSHDKPVFLFKHSTRCPISRSRWNVFQEFADGETRANFCQVLVVENKSLSQHIMQDTGVQHDSPQALLFSRGRVTWHISHWSITPASMSAALDEAIG